MTQFHDLTTLWAFTVCTKKGGTIPKKGGEIFGFPPIFLCVLDAEFNVDYDFAIKHDLIL